MLKREVIPIAKATPGLPRKNLLTFKCGDCLHFRRVAKFDGKPCIHLGVKRFAEAPSCFTVDPFLVGSSPDLVAYLGILLHDRTPQQRRVLIALMRQSSTTKKNFNLEFGQPVFFWMKSEYLSNFYRGYVLGTSNTSTNQVYVTSDLDGSQRKTPVYATLFRESVYSISEFHKKKIDLQKRGKLKDPAVAAPKKGKITIDYVPPTLENAPAEWLDKTLKKTTDKKKSSRHRELTGTLTFDVKRRRD